jgi:phage replication O-like protein O
VAQLEDGYTRIANDLLDRMALCKFSSREYKILLSVIRKTYGFGKKSDQLALSQLCKLTGLDLAACSRAVSGLIKSNVLRDFGGGSHARSLGIQTDVSLWPLVKTTTPCQNDKFAIVKTTTTKDKLKKGRQKLSLLSFVDRGGARLKRDKKIKAWAIGQFDVFWRTFDYKNGRKGAVQAWEKIVDAELKKPVREIKAKIHHILHAAELEAERRPQLRIDGRTPMMAQGWLNQERFDDETLTTWGRYAPDQQPYVDAYNRASADFVRGSRFMACTEWTEKRAAFFAKRAAKKNLDGWRAFVGEISMRDSVPVSGVTIDWLIANFHQFVEGRQ